MGNVKRVNFNTLKLSPSYFDEHFSKTCKLINQTGVLNHEKKKILISKSFDKTNS